MYVFFLLIKADKSNSIECSHKYWSANYICLLHALKYLFEFLKYTYFMLFYCFLVISTNLKNIFGLFECAYMWSIFSLQVNEDTPKRIYN